MLDKIKTSFIAVFSITIFSMSTLYGDYYGNSKDQTKIEEDIISLAKNFYTSKEFYQNVFSEYKIAHNKCESECISMIVFKGWNKEKLLDFIKLHEDFFSKKFFTKITHKMDTWPNEKAINNVTRPSQKVLNSNKIVLDQDITEEKLENSMKNWSTQHAMMLEEDKTMHTHVIVKDDCEQIVGPFTAFRHHKGLLKKALNKQLKKSENSYFELKKEFENNDLGNGAHVYLDTLYWAQKNRPEKK